MEDKKKYFLSKITIERKEYGENKGLYEGRITFDNNDGEYFSFKLAPGMSKPYIDLIANEIVKSAESLAENLIESLELKTNK